MKKLFTICVAIIFATQLSAQSANKKGFKSFKERIFSLQQKQNRNATMMGKSAFTEKLDSNIYENFNGTDWETDSYTHYTMDANGNLIEEYYYYWSSNKLYISKDSFAYDNNNRISVKTSFYQNMDMLVLNDKTEYEYNTDGNILKTNTFYWNSVNMTWENSNKSEYEYDANKNEVKNTSYYWSNNDWLEDYKEESVYNGNNKKTKSTSYSWDTDANDWIASYVTDITNNGDGNMTSSISQDWDEDNNIWVNDYKETYTYDANKNISTAIFEYWDIDNDMWYEDEKAVLNYDLNVSINDVAFPVNNYDGLNITNKVLRLDYFEKDNNDWVNSSKETYYYSPFTTSGINKNNVVSTTVYPNPAKDVVYFNSAKIELATGILIYDMSGKQVAKYDVNGNNTSVNISQLPAGFYMYQVVGTGFISSGKLVKE